MGRPDAGAIPSKMVAKGIANKHVMRQYRNAYRLLTKWGYTVQVAWWGQIDKNCLDPDEYTGDYELLTWAQFERMARHPNRFWDSVKEEFGKIKKFIQRQPATVNLSDKLPRKQKTLAYIPGLLPTYGEYYAMGCPKIIYKGNERVTIWREAVAKGWSNTLDTSATGVGKSHTVGISRVVPRKDPLVVALDELPTLYLPQIANWFAEGREDGFCGIIGYQTFPQLEKAYGREMAQTIFANTATKVIFNPQDHTSAEVYSKYLGEQEIRFKSKSRSTGKGGGSTSTNDQQQKRPLLEPAEFLKLPTGRAVIINPAYTRQKEAYVPLIESVKVPKADIAEMSWSEQKWSEVFERIGANNRKNLISDATRSIQLEYRHQLAEKLFPEDNSKKVPTAEELADLF